MTLDTKKIAVLVSGSGTNLQAIIDACKENKINGTITLVISNKENAHGLERARKNKIENYFIKDNEKILSLLKEKEIDLIVLAGYLKILPENMIKAFENKIINIHPSLIPSFCGKGFYGLKVHEAVFKKGVKFTGATTHFVNEEADQGPIINQDVVEIASEDSPEDIQKKVLEKEHIILVKSIKDFCDDKLIVKDGKVYRK